MELSEYIEKYGEVSGRKRHAGSLKAEKAKKLKYSKQPFKRLTKDWYIWRYGPDDGLKRFLNFSSKCVHKIENFIRLHGEEEGRRIYEETMQKKATITLENFIKKYGADLGRKKFEDHKKDNILKRNLTNYKKKYGDVEGQKLFDTKIESICKEYNIKDRSDIKLSMLCPDKNKIRPKKKFQSRGEYKIANFLERNNIEYIPQWKLEGQYGLSKKCPLRYDLYLPQKNIIIEYDGPHHFKPTRYKSQTADQAEKQFKLTKFYDQMKIVNAFISKISLIKIDYELFDILDGILYNELIEKSIINQLRIHLCENSDTDQRKHTIIIRDYQ